MGRELGGSDVPTTKAGVDRVLEDSLPLLGVTMPTVEYLNPLAPWRYPIWQRPLISVIHWAVQDLHPIWAQRLMNTRQYPRPVKALRRATVRALLSWVRDGVIQEVTQSHQRAAATPIVRSAETKPKIVAV